MVFDTFILRPSYENRNFEIPKELYHKKYDNVVLSIYINQKMDPQRNVYIDTDSYEYIKPLYSTLRDNDLHGIIFYDNLSQAFVNKYQTDKIIFLKCNIHSKSINDERFLLYYNYLLKYPYKYVLFSDVSDVYINKNPFDIMNNNTLYVGTNHNHKKPPNMWFRTYKSKIKHFNLYLNKNKYDEVGFVKEDVGIYSAGLIAGHYDIFIRFLSEYTKIMFIVEDCLKNNINDFNMLALNYLIRKYLLQGYNSETYCTDYVVTGLPFNSIFKEYEKLGVSKACLIHK